CTGGGLERVRVEISRVFNASFTDVESSRPAMAPPTTLGHERSAVNGASTGLSPIKFARPTLVTLGSTAVVLASLGVGWGLWASSNRRTFDAVGDFSTRPAGAWRYGLYACNLRDR